MTLYVIPMSGIGDRVKTRRKELKLSQGALAQAASEEGRPLTYQAIQAIEGGGETKHARAIAKALGVNQEWLETGAGPKEIASPPAPVGDPISLSMGYLSGYIDVNGMAECGPDGWSLWNGEQVARVLRPPCLAGVPKGYAVFAVGASMEDRYHPGELVYIHPGKPVGPGDYVLVQLHPKEDGEGPRAFLKRLVKRSGPRVILEQLNPKKTFELKADEIVSIHKVVGSGEA